MGEQKSCACASIRIEDQRGYQASLRARRKCSQAEPEVAGRVDSEGGSLHEADLICLGRTGENPQKMACVQNLSA